MTRIVDNGDGTRTFYVDQDRLEGAALLEDSDVELTDEQFEELTDEMRKVREEEEDGGSA